MEQKTPFRISREGTLGFNSPIPRPWGFLTCDEKAREDINQFSRDYKGNLHTFEDFEKAFAELEQIYIQMSHIGNYGFMPQTTDYSNEEFANIAQAGMEFETDASVALTFFDDALVEADEEVLDRLGKLPHLTAAHSSGQNQKSPLSRGWCGEGLDQSWWSFLQSAGYLH